MSKRKLEELAIILNPDLDQVAVAKEDIPAGTVLEYNGSAVKTVVIIKKGHRFALSDIKEGEFIRQYGFPFAQSMGISKGDLIEISNIKNVLPVDKDGADYKKPKETILKLEYSARTFLGYGRKDGKIGTRNYYLIVPTSMCSSETALQVALKLESGMDILKNYSNIDGIVAIPHTEGCGCDSGLQIDRLINVLKGYVRHPNVGGCLIMDLGCEQTNCERMQPCLRDVSENALKPIDWVSIQERGGTRRAIDESINLIKQRLGQVNGVKRQTFPIAKLIVGTECGASDSFSGITANSIIGNAVDKVIFGGGSAILSEVTEMVGAFDMMLPRFKNMETAHKFKKLLDWYMDLAKRLGLTLEPNLVPKNIEGGLINNYIKSLGAVIKGGTTVIEDVIDYAEPLKTRGLNIMQGPGNDPESLTGIVASGANIVCFSTGKGTTTGDAICPVIKITSNEDTFSRLPEDMDFDGSRLLREKAIVDNLGQELLDKIISVASGEKTWSEKWKQRQFQIWTAGKLSL